MTNAIDSHESELVGAFCFLIVDDIDVVSSCGGERAQAEGGYLTVTSRAFRGATWYLKAPDAESKRLQLHAASGPRRRGHQDYTAQLLERLRSVSPWPVELA